MKSISSVSLLLFVSLSAFAKDLISITAVGDIMMGTTYPSDALPDNRDELFNPATPWIKASDIRFGNFEGTFFDGPPQRDGKSPGPNRYLFRTPTTFIDALSAGGFNVVSLSNNHARDFGSKGLTSTKETLASAQIQYSSKAGEVAQFQVDETVLSLIAVDYYKAPRSITDPTDTYAEIRRLKEKNHLVIVSVHAGGEGNGAEYVKDGNEIFLGENRGNSIGFAHDAIDQGADVIIMHGPHVPRGLELYKNRLIIYSLGNFMTGKGINLGGNSALAPLVRVQIDHTGQFFRGQIVSFEQKRSPQRLELDRQNQALRLMKSLSEKQFPQSPLRFENDGQFK